MRAHGSGRAVLESDLLRVTVTPQIGGTITAIEHKGLGASVLGTVPGSRRRRRSSRTRQGMRRSG